MNNILRRSIRWIPLWVLLLTAGWIPLRAQTNCVPIGLPLEENFNTTDSLPTCWVRDENFDAEAWKAHIVSDITYEGIGALMISCGNDASDIHQTFVMTPQLNQSPAGIRMKLRVRANQAGTVLRVGVCESNSMIILFHGFVEVTRITVEAANVWEEHEIDFSGYSGNGDRVCFRMVQEDQNGAVGRMIYLDDVGIERCSVKDLLVDHRASDELTLHWTSLGTGTTDLTVTPADGGNPLTFTNVTSPYRILGLTPLTTYTLTLTPHCEGETLPGVEQSTVSQTLPGPHEGLVYCEDFESSQLPTGWTGHGTAATSSGYSYGGYRSLYLASGNANHAALPELTLTGGTAVPLSDLQLSLMMYCVGSGARLEVCAANYPEETAELVPIDTLEPVIGGIWEPVTVSLSHYDGSMRQLVLRAIGGTVYVDDLRVGRCLLTGVTVEGRTATSVTLGWDVPLSEGNVTIEPLSGGGSTLTVDSTDYTEENGRRHYTIENLEAGSSHSWAVYGSCDDGHCGAATVSATTFAQDYTVPYCTDFEEGGSLPTDWTTVNGTIAIASDQYHSTSHALRLTGTASQPAVVMLPPIAGTLATVSFAAYATASGCQVDVGTVDAGGSFTTEATATLTAGQWDRHTATVDLTLTAEGSRLALRLRHSSGGQQSAWVDDLEAATCGVSAVSAYGERATGATLQWTTTGTGSVDVQVRHSGSSAVQTTTDATSPLSVDGLEQGTTYNYYLRSTCGGEAGCWVYGGQFTTNSGALTADYCHSTTLSIGTTAWSLPYLEETNYTGLLVSMESQRVSGSGELQVGLMDDADNFTLLASFTPGNAGSWSHHSTGLGGHENDGHYIALRTTGGTVQVRHLRLSRGNLLSSAVTGVSATTATFGWETEGVVDSVRIYIDGVVDTTVSAAIGNYQQSGLSAGTSYQYTLTAVSAASGHSCSVDGGTFATLDADIEEGYCFGFDGVGYGSLPTGWGQLGGGSMTGVYYYSGSARLRLSASSGNPALVTLPATTANLDGLKMRFEAETGDNSGGSLLIVGRMTDAADATTFTATDTVRLTTERRTYAVDLGSGNIGNVVALRYESNSYYAYVDNIGFAQQQVGELTTSELTNHSMRVEWTMEGGQWPVTVTWKANGSSVTYDTTLTGTSVVIDGLTANTSYTITVRPAAEQEETACRSITASTHTLETSMTLPLCLLLEDYNSTTQLPYGWTRPFGSQPVSQTSTRYEGNRALRFYTSYGQSMVCSPMLETASLEGYYLSFMLMNSYSNSTVEAGVMTDPNDSATFTPLASYNYLPNWTRCEVALTNLPAGAKYIAFRHTVDWSSAYAYIDQVMLQSCAMPTVTLQNPRSNSLEVVWSGADSVHIQWGIGSSVSGSVVTAVSPYTLTGLASSTTYTVSVWPICNGDEDFECQKVRQQMTTLAEAQTVPFCQEFNNYGLPSGWLSATSGGSVYTTSGTPDGSWYAMQLYAYSGGSATLILPILGFDTSLCDEVSTIYLHFMVRNISGNGTLEAGTLHDMNAGGSDFTAYATVPLNDNWTEVTVGLPLAAARDEIVALRLTSPQGNASVSIDQFCVGYCFFSSTTLVSVTNDSVTFEWDNYSVETLTVSWNGGSYTTTESPFSITDLDANEIYAFNFTAQCPCSLSFHYSTAVVFEERLPADPMVLPYCNSFDTASVNTFPNPWRRTGGYWTSHPRVTANPSYSPDHSIDLYTSPSYPLTLAFEPLADTVGDVVLGLRLYCSNTDAAESDRLTVGLMDDAEDPSTFTEVSSLAITATDTWEDFHVALPQNARGGKLYIALRFSPQSTYHLYIDDLSVASCAVTSLSATDATLNIGLSGGQYTLTIENNTTGDTQQMTSGNTSPALSTLGISPDSAYTVTATPLCSDGSTPECNALSIVVGQRLALPYCEPFDETTLHPDGWEVIARNGAQYPRIENGRYHLRPSGSDPDNNDLVLLPALPYGLTLGGLNVKVDVSVDNINSAYLALGYMQGSAFIELVQLHNTASNQTHYTTLPACNGSRLAIRGLSTSGVRNLYLDNLQLTLYPEPEEFTLSQTGHQWQHLYWDNLGDNAYYSFEWGPQGFESGSGTVVSSDSCHVVLGPLSGSTQYQYYLLDTAGNRFCQPRGFTSMPAATAIPYCDNSNYYLSAGQLYILPEVSVPIDTLTLLVTWRTTANGKLVIGAITDCSDAATFIPLDTLLPAQANTYTRTAVDLYAYADTGHFVALRFDDAAGYLSQLTLQAVPQPRFHVLNSSTIEATVDADTADYYLTVGNNSLHVTDTHYLITGLEPYTDYSIYVSANGEVTCQPAVTLRTHLDVSIPYCTTLGSLPDGWNLMGRYRVMPYPLVDSLAGLHLYLTSKGSVAIGAQSVLDDTTDFLLLCTLSGSSWEEQHVDLNTYGTLIGDRHYIALRYESSDAAVQSFVVQRIPRPQFEVISSSSVRATLPDYDTADYYIEVCAAGSAQGTGTVHHVTSNDYLITGLEMYTPYDFYARSDADLPTCASPVPLLTHLDIEPPYCSVGNLTGWYLNGSFQVMPYTITDTMTDIYVTFRSRGNMALGVQATLTDTASFTPLASYSSTTWADHTVHLADYADAVAGNHYVSFHGGEVQHVYLHTCPVPTATLSAFNTVRFEQADDSIDYWIEFSDSIVHAVGNPFYITGLEQNTQYSFSYRCDSAVATCLPPATLLTGVQIAAPYCIDLNGHAMNSGTPSGTAGWFTLLGSNDERYLAMPIIDLDSINRLYLRLRYRVGQAGNALAIGVMSDPYDETTFSALTTLSAVSASWQTLTLAFRAYADSGLYVAFRASGNAPQQVRIDHIELQTVPFADYSLIAHNEVLVSADGMPQPTQSFYIQCGDSLIAVDTLPYLVTGLADDSLYLFNLRASLDAEPCNTPTSVSTTHLAATPLCGLEASLSGDQPLWRGPELAETDITSLLLRFNAQAGSSGLSVVVGTLRLRNVDTTFTPLDTIPLNLGSGTYTSSLANYTGPGRFLALRLLPSNAGSSVGLSDITLDHCLLPLSARLTLMRHNIVRLDLADTTESLTGMRVEYGPAGFAAGSGTEVVIDSLPLDFTLANSTLYVFRLLCDGSDTSCIAPLTITTLDAPPALSWCADFDDVSTGQLPPSWTFVNEMSSAQLIEVSDDRSHSPAHSLYFNSTIGHNNIAILPDLGRDTLRGLALSFWMNAANTSSAHIDVGVIFNTSDPTSFYPLHTVTCTEANQWERKLVDLNQAPDGAYFIALRCQGYDGLNRFWIDDLHVAECGASGLVVTQVEAESITLRWQQTGSPAVSIIVQPADSAAWTVDVPSTPYFGQRTLTINNLQPLTNYRFTLSAVCNGEDGYCTTDYTDSCRIFTPAGGTGCIDPTNLTADYTTCFYGDYGNPYANTGSLDYGYASALSRHTVHYDLDERDPRTGGLLSTVPQGSMAAVRLGNWATSGAEPGQAESIVYGLTVDTVNFNMLILRYAAVLQDPMHPVSAQPRFSLELLDEQMQILDSSCGRADFIADYNMGWHYIPSTSVLWKDWTTVGMDLTPYAGQTIYIRLTTRDCEEGSHYGYSYFTLSCGNKNIVASGCGVIEENDLTAPSGFLYRWYTSADTATISTAQQITVPSNNDVTYLCDVSMVDNESCTFTMSAFAGTRYPLSLFDYDVQLAPCSFVVNFTNHSTISMDQVNPVGTGEGVESNRWFFGNGQTSTAVHPTVLYPDSGTYIVTLVTGIAGDECLDTLTDTLHLAFPPTGLRIEGPLERCWNDTADTLHLYNACDDWQPADTVWQLASSDSVGTHLLKHYILIVDSTTYPAGDYNFSLDVLDSVGCTVNVTHSLTVHPTYRLHDQARICSLLLPYAWRDTTVSDTNILPLDTNHYTLHRLSADGCDSVMTLTLLQHDNAYYTPRDTAYDDLCDNQTYYFSDSLLVAAHYLPATSITYTDSLTSAIGCDSLSTIVLTVHPTYDHHLYDTVCTNLGYTWGTPQRGMFQPWSVTTSLHGSDSVVSQFQAPSDTSYTDSLLSVYSCDSISSLHLHLRPAYDLHFSDTICDDTTYTFAATQHDSTGIYSYSFVAQGCDSLRTLHLKVYPTYDLHFYDTIYDGDSYTFEATSYDTTGIYSHLLAATFGCDSLRTLHLQRNRRSYLDTVICINTLPFTWHHQRGGENADVVFDNPMGTFGNGWVMLSDSVHLLGQDDIDSLVVMLVIARDTSSTTDLVHSCDSFYWHNDSTLYLASTSSPAVLYSQVRPMDTTGLGALLPGSHLAPYTTHLAPYSIFCDSVRHLNLTVDYTHYYTDIQLACDSLQWLDRRWYLRDTLGIVGPLGSRTASGPVDTLLTVGGCDSVINLDLAVRYSTYHCDIDTFCWNQLYTWREQTAGDTAADHWSQTEGYYLSETLHTHTFTHPSDRTLTTACDSVLAIQLTQMARPRLTLFDSIDCQRQQYTLRLQTNVDYRQWTSGTSLFSNDTAIVVSPTSNTTYIAYVDYHRTPLCPRVDSLRMRPIVVPEAILKVNPDALRYNEMVFDAYDNSVVRPNAIHLDDPLVWNRSWYLDWRPLNTSDPHITHEATADDDSLLVALTVFNGQCHDTSIVLLPVLRTAIFAPNVFTPYEDNNNLFTIVTQGVTEAHLYIYNREGLLVHRSDDLSAGWDGTDLNGRPCQQGNYVWKLTYRGIDHPDGLRTEVGTVLILY